MSFYIRGYLIHRCCDCLFTSTLTLQIMAEYDLLYLSLLHGVWDTHHVGEESSSPFFSMNLMEAQLN